MAFTAQDYEKYLGRLVMAITCLDQRIVGIPLEPIVNSYGGIVYFTIKNDNGKEYRRGVSCTSIEGVWDMNPVWNECPVCNAAPGDSCKTVALCHSERFAGHQADALTQKRKQESADRAKLAASRRTHTEDSVIAGSLPATTG